MHQTGIRAKVLVLCYYPNTCFSVTNFEAMHDEIVDSLHAISGMQRADGILVSLSHKLGREL